MPSPRARLGALVAAGAVAAGCGADSPTSPGAPSDPSGAAAGVRLAKTLNTPPVLRLSTTPPADQSTLPYPTITGAVPLTVRFNLCRSSDADENPDDPELGDTLNWQFHFGDDDSEPFHEDGSFNAHVGHRCRVDHTYTEAGRYTVTVSVTDKHLEDQSRRASALARVTTRLTVVALEEEGAGPAPPKNASPPTTCSSSCVVFVTSTLYTGDLGGVAGADAKCAERAAAAGLPGRFAAWVSDADFDSSPAARFVRSTRPYRLRDGTVVADDWDDLTDGALDHHIDLDELGGPAPSMFVWTGAVGDGTPAFSGFCDGWTNGTLTAQGRNGLTTGALHLWTAQGATFSCRLLRPIYCFQQ